LFTGGVIWTGEQDSDALFVDDGVVRALGDEAREQASAPGVEQVDLDGGFLMPSFGDGHAHPLYGGLEAVGPPVRPCQSVDEIVAAVKKFADEHPELEWISGDVLALPFADSTFDAVTIGFGVRNVADLERGLRELHRVLRGGGRLAILDLLSHRFERARDLYADLWLGFSEVQLHQFLEKSGFRQIEVSVVSREKQGSHFQTVLATGIK